MPGLYTPEQLDQLNPCDYIIIKSAQTNNLKKLSVAIPRYKMVVITGLSGSGKTSLAFDTLYAEGQRMYIESLSVYARQFLDKMKKPAVEYIRGIAPAIAINQRISAQNPRSTVGTVTEVYEYLKLLYAKIGTTYSPISNTVVKRDSVSDVVDYIAKQPSGSKLIIISPLHLQFENWSDSDVVKALQVELRKGFTRILQNDEILFIEDLIENPEQLSKDYACFVLIDRMVLEDDVDKSRLASSVGTAFFESNGYCVVQINNNKKNFSNLFELDGVKFEKPTVDFFSFNNPFGACKRCNGTGIILGVDPKKVIPDSRLSISGSAVLPWQSELMQHWQEKLVEHAHKFNFPLDCPYYKLTKDEKRLLWDGNEYFKGIHDFFDFIESQKNKTQYRILLSRYSGYTECHICKGARIRKDAGYVKIQNFSIVDLVVMPIERLVSFFQDLPKSLNKYETTVSDRILSEIQDRLNYLMEVGLGYLTLNRSTNTLSGGEHQRIRLATALGSTLVDTMYILDEPTIGLHQRDVHRLTKILINLRDLHNTIIVVEHEEEVMRAADQLIDIGPAAGIHGGELSFQGDMEALKQCSNSPTARYLNGLDTISIPSNRRTPVDHITLKGVYANNLKNLDVEIPLGVLTVVTGVSGSGKSTLIMDVLYNAVKSYFENCSEPRGEFEHLSVNWRKISQVRLVDQQPIGKSPRSIPLTYIKAYDAIRQLFASQSLSQQRGYKVGQFSFNVEGGRCEACQGDGEMQIEMQFMADINLVCESCQGKRFKEETLEVTYKEKNIYDVLKMTVDEGLIFFEDQPEIIKLIQPLETIGLGYIQLGQGSNTLSGGEAQRIKLATYLGVDQQHKSTLFIFDEPSTGLHALDVHKLIKAVQQLVDAEHSVIIIEHNLDIIKCADYIIDLGPEGGEYGGQLLFSGTPEEMIRIENNYTAKYLKEKMK